MAKQTTGTTAGELTATALKTALWDTLNGVKDGNVQPGVADAIACQAREIVRTVKVQIQVANQSKRPLAADVIAFAEK